MNSIRLLLSGIAIAVTFVAQLAVATPHQLVITESSGNNLTVTYDGSAGVVTVVPVGPETWNLFFPSSVLFPTGIRTWVEPESSLEINELRQQGGGPLELLSDIAAFGHPAPNGATVSFGTDGGVPISVTFNDNANNSSSPVTVPETGSTLGLFCLSLVALFAGTRLRLFQKA